MVSMALLVLTARLCQAQHFFRCAAEGWAAASLPLDTIASGLYLKFRFISKGWGLCLAMDGKD